MNHEHENSNSQSSRPSDTDPSSSAPLPSDLPAVPTSIDLSGQQLGDYHLLRRLGQGAMAEVYLAEQESLERRVALKVLRQDLSSDSTYVQRFEREARAAARLSHPNIVQVFEVGLIDKKRYIAQEYIDGVNLKQWITRNGSVDLYTGLVVMWHVASALARAAESQIVHRDIKPENILLARNGEVKVADFGLARSTGTTGVDLTQIGVTLGTPLYMSPEQIEGGPIDPRSDIYSFGVTCYHMFAGQPPFTGETALSVAVQHLKRDPKPLSSHCEELPPALCRVIHRMLAKEPADRFDSPQEMLRELRAIRKSLGDQWPEHLPSWEMESVDTETSCVEVTQRLSAMMKDESSQLKKSRSLAIWVAASLLALLVGVITAWTMISEQPSLLADADRAQPIPLRKTIGEQWVQAARLGTEDAWLAVVNYEPDNPDGYWARHAKQQLARLYLDDYDYDQAAPIFDEFSMLDDTEPELRAFGMAGQCWIANRSEQHDVATQKLNDLWDHRQYLVNDPIMLGMLNRVLEHSLNDSDSGVSRKEWQGWLNKELDPEQGSDSSEN